jgi:hypothetical protein
MTIVIKTVVSVNVFPSAMMESLFIVPILLLMIIYRRIVMIYPVRIIVVTISLLMPTISVIIPKRV